MYNALAGTLMELAQPLKMNSGRRFGNLSKEIFITLIELNLDEHGKTSMAAHGLWELYRNRTKPSVSC